MHFKIQKIAKNFKVKFDPVPTPTLPKIFSSLKSEFFNLSFELFKITVSRCPQVENRVLKFSGISKFRENSRKKNFFSKTVTKFQTGLQVIFSIFPFFKFALASLLIKYVEIHKTLASRNCSQARVI